LELIERAQQPRPLDLESRLENLLIVSAVIPSAERGLLGSLSYLVVCGDGSALESGASSTGRPTCDCRTNRVYNCNCDRFYSDSTADWGWDSYREVYYFGHTYYQHVVSSSGHDLPVQVRLGPASETDFTLSLHSLDRLEKAMSDNRLKVKIGVAVYDSGHDARGIYRYLEDKKIKPVIALNARSGHPKATGTAERVTDEGVPVCAAGLEMRRHSTSPNHRLYFNCPVKRPTHVEGKTLWESHVEECPLKVLCQPLTKMGPVVYVRSDSDPRLYPEIARSSPGHRKMMNLRSGCERSNSVKKVVHRLGERVCRSATQMLVRLYLVSIIEHAKAWLAEDRKLVGEDYLALADPEKIKEMASVARVAQA
jgi:hypothetical protein